MALGAFEFTAEQVEVLRAEQANPNCKFAGVDDLGRCTDEAMIVQMGAALRRASVELTEQQQRALGAPPSSPTPTWRSAATATSRRCASRTRRR